MKYGKKDCLCISTDTLYVEPYIQWITACLPRDIFTHKDNSWHENATGHNNLFPPLQFQISSAINV